ncbi:MAG: nucleotidyltransferase family protein [Nanoarchaeota archaeon]|nr:nucleotidyltransferase family protein [Nanoarchaeota archaeon]MBU1028270.1 nucleotidyltransferase family protein [Nanoarchaeota archaeon]
MENKNIQAIILAGGLGKRLRPLTKTIPKPMVKINNKPFLEFKIEQLKQHNIFEIILCVGYLGEKIEAYFGDGKKFGVNITYSYEKELLGTAGAIKNAESLINSKNFLVMNGDVFVPVDLSKFLEFHEIHKPLLSMVVTSATNPFEQELVNLDRESILNFYKRDTEEHRDHLKKTKFPLINGGVYIFDKFLLDFIPLNKKCSLEQEIFPNLLGKIKAFLYEDYFIDIGNIDSLEEFRNKLNNKNK